MMLVYERPGNVRELRNAVEHGMICAKNNIIEISSLPQDINAQKNNSENNKQNSLMEENSQQRDKIITALRDADGNRAEAAEQLGINRTTLWRRMQRLDINEDSLPH